MPAEHLRAALWMFCLTLLRDINVEAHDPYDFILLDNRDGHKPFAELKNALEPEHSRFTFSTTVVVQQLEVGNFIWMPPCAHNEVIRRRPFDTTSRDYGQ